MSRIVERVPSKIVTDLLKGTMCKTCGCGRTNETQDTKCDHRPVTKWAYNETLERHEALEYGPVCPGTRVYEETPCVNKVPGHVVIRCDCGKHLTGGIGQFTISCECGADYNGSGSRLAPRSQWGEETGESASDILMVDGMSTEDLLDGSD